AKKRDFSLHFPVSRESPHQRPVRFALQTPPSSPRISVLFLLSQESGVFSVGYGRPPDNTWPNISDLVD
ncbi:MAG: hypothetical protein QM744_00850, partial [Mesorhizobium sp.]